MRRGKIFKRLISIFLALAILFGGVYWIVTRNTLAAAISTDGCTNPFITSLGSSMIASHRSGGGIAPENTMMAFKNCVENSEFSVDIFEFDLHITADGVLVLLHDESLDRTSDAVSYFGETSVLPSQKTFSQLQALNMGENFTQADGSKPYQGLRGDDIPDDLRITSLDQVFAYLENYREYRYIIEIKDSGSLGQAAVDALYALLRAYDCLDRAIVGTFHNDVTEYLDCAYPDILRSASIREVAGFYAYSLLNLPRRDDQFRFQALQIPTDDYVLNLATSRLVNYAHKHNIAVQYWTINDPDEMSYLLSIGADAIITDVPNLAHALLRR